jgi:hypothetical protein
MISIIASAIKDFFSIAFSSINPLRSMHFADVPTFDTHFLDIVLRISG